MFLKDNSAEKTKSCAYLTISPNGFTEPRVFKDFPQREYKVALHVSRRRWIVLIPKDKSIYSPIKCLFNDVEQTFDDVECKFSDTERIFNVAE